MKKLYLSNKDKKIAGVCGGLAEFLEIDSTIVRLLTILLALITAVIPVVITYLIAAAIIPHRPGDNVREAEVK